MADMIEVARATVTIIPNMKGSQSAITKEITGASEEAGDEGGKSMGKSMLGQLALVMTSAAVGKILKSAVMDAADLEQSLGGIETLFKDSADTVKQNAQNANPFFSRAIRSALGVETSVSSKETRATPFPASAENCVAAPSFFLCQRRPASLGSALEKREELIPRRREPHGSGANTRSRSRAADRARTAWPAGRSGPPAPAS